jgi:NADPH2:quinone reductase
MKAIYLARKGDPSKAFELREVPVPTVKPGEVLIRVEASGLNFADVLARQGLYPDAPPMPSVLGYDVVGTVTEIAPDVQAIRKGDRVAAMTHFGGYAEYAIAPALLAAPVPDSMPAGEATALTVQYCTAYFAAAEVVNLHPGDRVLIHAAAGGVGTALVQYCKYKECEIFATAGSDRKLGMLKDAGVHHPVNYKSEDFAKTISNITGGKGVDVIFDSVGGATTKKGYRLLAPGGRIVCYGAADVTGKSLFGKLGLLLGYGLYIPLRMMAGSKSIIGVNMLRIAENKTMLFHQVLEQVVQLYNDGVFKPVIGELFPASDIAKAHALLASRQSVGKISITW